MDAVDLKDTDLDLQAGQDRFEALVTRLLREYPVEGAISRQPTLFGSVDAGDDLAAQLTDGALLVVQNQYLV